MKSPEVRLVSITQPEENLSPEGFLAWTARVSSPQNRETGDTEKLLSYCLKNGHWSVFEHVFLTVEVQTTREITRQILRHRSFCFQEFSGRYSEVDTSRFVLKEARRQDTKNRQNSFSDLPLSTESQFLDSQMRVWELAEREYKRALSLGVAKECARSLLPEGMTPSTLYMSGNVRSFIHYLDQRLDPSSQKEHREVAEKIRDNIFVANFPIISRLKGWETEEREEKEDEVRV